MSRLCFTVPGTRDGRSLRDILRGDMGLSYTRVKRLKQTPDGVMVNGAHARADLIVSVGDVVSVLLDAPQNIEEEAHNAPPMPPVLFEDEHQIGRAHV